MSLSYNNAIKYHYGIHAKHTQFYNKFDLFQNDHACAFVLPIDQNVVDELFTLIRLYSDKPIIMLHYKFINQRAKPRQYIVFDSFTITNKVTIHYRVKNNFN